MPKPVGRLLLITAVFLMSPGTVLASEPKSGGGDCKPRYVFSLADRFREGEFSKDEARQRIRERLNAHLSQSSS